MNMNYETTNFHFDGAVRQNGGYSLLFGVPSVPSVPEIIFGTVAAQSDECSGNIIIPPLGGNNFRNAGTLPKTERTKL